MRSKGIGSERRKGSRGRREGNKEKPRNRDWREGREQVLERRTECDWRERGIGIGEKYRKRDC